MKLGSDYLKAAAADRKARGLSEGPAYVNEVSLSGGLSRLPELFGQAVRFTITSASKTGTEFHTIEVRDTALGARLLLMSLDIGQGILVKGSLGSSINGNGRRQTFVRATHVEINSEANDGTGSA